MTDDNKRNDDQDRKKLSDEEMEDVAGGYQVSIDTKGRSVAKGKKKGSDGASNIMEQGFAID